MTSHNAPPSRFPTRLDDLVNMLPTILMRRLQVVQLLVEIGDIRFQLRRLGREPLLHVVRGTEHEPASQAIRISLFCLIWLGNSHLSHTLIDLGVLVQPLDLGGRKL